jgi:Uma2 family endonuclease
MAIQKKLYTVEEFEEFADSKENRDRRFELINGEIYEKMPTEEHGIVAVKIILRVGSFIEEHDLGERLGVEIRHRIPGDKHNARLPDISFTYDPATPIVKKGSVPRMPDLAIEIQSPDDDFQDLHAKAKYYLQNGSRLSWLFFPKTRTVDVCTWNAQKRDIDVKTLTIDDTLDGNDVLPGFKVAVRDIFPKQEG